MCDVFAIHLNDDYKPKKIIQVKPKIYKAPSIDAYYCTILRHPVNNQPDYIMHHQRIQHLKILSTNESKYCMMYNDSLLNHTKKEISFSIPINYIDKGLNKLVNYMHKDIDDYVVEICNPNKNVSNRGKYILGDITYDTNSVASLSFDLVMLKFKQV